MCTADTVSRLRILSWELAGAAFACGAGSALHFAYAWSGEWPPVALVAAMNESVWEHLKLAFWPTLVFAALQWPFVRGYARNFLAGKTLNLALVPLLIVVGFYGYTAILGSHQLAIDISLFVLAIFVGHASSYLVLTARPAPRWVPRLAGVLLILEVAAFSLFSYFPPNAPLFADPTSHGAPTVATAAP
jgi:hypothetical protein